VALGRIITNFSSFARSGVFRKVFWIVTLYSVEVGYQHFGGGDGLQIWKITAFIRWRQKGPPKLWYPTAALNVISIRENPDSNSPNFSVICLIFIHFIPKSTTFCN
jgi:hypothetical protein